MAASLRPASRLAARPLSATTAARLAQTTSPLLRATASSQFHTSSKRCATPAGPPPPGFRLPKPKRFDEGENAYDKASNYFLLTELFRGMYVVLEQYFRPPYVIVLTASSVYHRSLSLFLAIQSITLTKRAPSLPVSVANTPSAATPPAKNDASPVSSAKPSVPRRRSPLKLKSEKTARDGRQDTTST